MTPGGIISRAAREPALWFALLGGAIFLVHALFAGRESGPARDDIVLSSEFVAGLRQDHLRRIGREPSPQQQQHDIREFVRQEVLFREAVALGLDRADLVIRRRLVQKMEFLLRDMSAPQEPGDRELAEYLAAHRERYRDPATITFRHVFVNSRGDWQRARARAVALRRELSRGPPAGADGDGSPAPDHRLAPGDPFPLGDRFEATPVARLERDLGRDMVAAMQALPLARWSAPLRSHYGWHLVWVVERTPARDPGLAEVRERVVAAWQDEQRQRAQADYLAELIGRYRVRIEEPAPVPAVYGARAP